MEFYASAFDNDDFPTGKWAVALWYKDTDKNDNATRVYVVKYFYLVAGVEKITPISPLDEYGDLYVEKCDYEPVII